MKGLESRNRSKAKGSDRSMERVLEVKKLVKSEEK